MFEDILGENKEETKKKKLNKKKIKRGVNLMPKGQTIDTGAKPAKPSKYKSHKKVSKRAMKIRKDIKNAENDGVEPI